MPRPSKVPQGRSTDIQREVASKGVDWEFIIEKATCQGGFYERMIQSTKRCLKNLKFEIISTNRTQTRKAKYQKRLLDQFINRWRTKYFLSVRETSRLLHGAQKEEIAAGDVVVLKNDRSSRIFWKLARVTELIVSKDGVVRAAKVCVASTTKVRSSELRRPIQLEFSLKTKTL
ncbi:uncharacterized protein LOC124449128 [Xenia sp. Carnegie-2017]|uniref:uncharacterized protein LOC124449128 n=1 Tax=Xenia sp. Carnegie-2017 TaxID=2897299 RepID=UPI001F04048D|nr:uncharacterized protein LOC124449128 [Xenia sp. Carnegie-2017]